MFSRGAGGDEGQDLFAAAPESVKEQRGQRGPAGDPLVEVDDLAAKGADVLGVECGVPAVQWLAVGQRWPILG